LSGGGNCVVDPRTASSEDGDQPPVSRDDKSSPCINPGNVNRISSVRGGDDPTRAGMQLKDRDETEDFAACAPQLKAQPADRGPCVAKLRLGKE